MNRNNFRGSNAYLGRAMSLEEIAQIEGVTKERIRQIEKRALNKVNKYLLQRFGESVTLWDILPFPEKENHYEQMQSL